MRRVVPLVLISVVVLNGCGTEHPVQAPRARASSSPAPSQAAAGPQGPLAGFPLALGYAKENGDDHTPVVVSEQPGMRTYRVCAQVAWDPHTGTTDVIGTEFRGEAEWSRGRTLVLYPTEEAAATAVDAARSVVQQCREETDGDGNVSVHTVYDDTTVGDQSLVWADTYGLRESGQVLVDTGLTAYHLVRVGRAVLASYEYGEGNPGGGQRPDALVDASAADQRVVQRMAGLPHDAPSPDIPADFPLTRGLAPPVGADITGPERDIEGVFLETVCNSGAWPGLEGQLQLSDRLVVTETLPDWAVTRELVTYDTEAQAGSVVTQLRTDVAGCRSAEGEPVTMYDADTGHDAVTFGTPLNDDGQVLYQVVRVGRAVVATSQYTSPSDDDVREAVDELTGDLTPVTTAMACDWSGEGCAPVDDAVTVRSATGATRRTTATSAMTAGSG